MVTIYQNDGCPLRSSGNAERNQPCGCGSGKKAKRCCGMETRYMLTGKALDNHIRKIQAAKEAEAIKEKAKQLQEGAL